jgi:hypothetical protein
MLKAMSSHLVIADADREKTMAELDKMETDDGCL